MSKCTSHMPRQVMVLYIFLCSGYFRESTPDLKSVHVLVLLIGKVAEHCKTHFCPIAVNIEFLSSSSNMSLIHKTCLSFSSFLYKTLKLFLEIWICLWNPGCYILFFITTVLFLFLFKNQDPVLPIE